MGSLFSRNHIREDFEAFENAPDTGLLPKAFSRFIKRIINYLFKGVFGTVVLVVGMVFSCIAISLTSIILAALAPIYAPVLALLYYLICAVFFDWQGDSFFNAVFWNVFGNFLCLGILQTVASFFVAFVVCPVGSAAVALFAVSRKVFRNAWDSFVFEVRIIWFVRPGSEVEETTKTC